MQNNFNFTGIIFLVFVVIFGTFLVLVNVMYKNVKKVEATINNLHDQMKDTTMKLETIKKEETALPAKDLLSYGDNWQSYVHQNFGFRFKSPLGWGNFDLQEQGADTPIAESPGKYFIGKFNFKPASELSFELKTNDNRLGKNYSSEAVRRELAGSDSGECDETMFKALEELNIGEIRNCYVKENAMEQKYLTYRFVNINETAPSVSQSVALYPMRDYYIAVLYPDKLSSDESGFIQSLVFETNQM